MTVLRTKKVSRFEHRNLKTSHKSSIRRPSSSFSLAPSQVIDPNQAPLVAAIIFRFDLSRQQRETKCHQRFSNVSAHKSLSVVGKKHKSWEHFRCGCWLRANRQLNQIECSNSDDFISSFRLSKQPRLQHVKLSRAVNVFHKLNFYLYGSMRSVVKDDVNSILITLIFDTLIITRHKPRIAKKTAAKSFKQTTASFLLACLFAWWFVRFFTISISCLCLWVQ